MRHDCTSTVTSAGQDASTAPLRLARKACSAASAPLDRDLLQPVHDRAMIYVLLAEQAMVARVASAFQEKRYEDGLTQALEEVSALLVTHFTATAQATSEKQYDNLPDEPVLQ